ncbi:glutamate decarboxylase [Phaffia rhodozyma]|uniref:Glutamate decarboxylase n=1 Tax=Phaffia rhodozyma TaxID=264483 RepID=A0A0F7SPA8_PHARH|nr:glutamate decarboxylase [Phaffia rhodozyma]
MGLLGQVRSDESVNHKQEKKEPKYDEQLIYGSKFTSVDIPQWEMPEESMPADTAYSLIRDELELDGTPSLNLASFVSTSMEDQAMRLMTEQLGKNMIDYQEYPSTVELHNRCVNMIARMFNAPVDANSPDSVGVSTVGSSEAIILAVLAMKRKWKVARKAAGKSTENPNLVMSSAVQVCWEKATRYLEIEEKFVNVTKTRYVIDPKEAVSLVDENTIGVVAILGTTYTGEYEDVAELARLLDEKEKETGLDVKIHVDAASGGFVAPFVKPDLVWDFRIPRVVSINVSGHKYGLVVAGVGWAIWRSHEYLPEDLVFHVAYLGADQASFTLNFSKSAVQILAQYYILIRNGKEGFRAIMNSTTVIADWFADKLVESGRFDLLTPGHGDSLPVVAFKLKDGYHYDEFAIADALRSRNWIVPAYVMAPGADKMKLLRVVCRSDFSKARAERLIRDINATCEHLDTLDKKTIDQNMDKRSADQKQAHTDRSAVHGKGDKEDSLMGKHGKTHAVC